VSATTDSKAPITADEFRAMWDGEDDRDSERSRWIAREICTFWEDGPKHWTWVDGFCAMWDLVDPDAAAYRRIIEPAGQGLADWMAEHPDGTVRDTQAGQRNTVSNEMHLTDNIFHGEGDLKLQTSPLEGSPGGIVIHRLMPVAAIRFAMTGCDVHPGALRCIQNEDGSVDITLENVEIRRIDEGT
jgi:hypothetical protein